MIRNTADNLYGCRSRQWITFSCLTGIALAGISTVSIVIPNSVNSNPSPLSLVKAVMVWFCVAQIQVNFL